MDPKIDKLLHHADYSEKMLEKYLVKRVRESGGLCLKYSNPAEVGYPDRIVIMPNKGVFFVELKSKGEKPRPIQKKRMEELEKLGLISYVCDSKQKIDETLYYAMDFLRVSKNDL